ncbi:YqaE/Pmp3 family membrane protein [bacterium]|nr:YqaE/Pmp3 family membrane protein [bacterium]
MRDIGLLFSAIFFPPLTVYLKKGVGNEFYISIVLLILFWLPSIFYAFWIIGPDMIDKYYG